MMLNSFILDYDILMHNQNDFKKEKIILSDVYDHNYLPQSTNQFEAKGVILLVYKGVK